MLAAGKLDRLITIQRKTATARDAMNTPIEVWSDLTTVAAAKEDVRDSERVAAQQVGAEITTRFQIRYSSKVADVDPTDRLLFGGRVYGIVAVKEIGRRERLELTASAKAERV